MLFRSSYKECLVIVVAAAFVLLADASPPVVRIAFAVADGEPVPEARRPDALTTSMALENDLLGAKFDSPQVFAGWNKLRAVPAFRFTR